MLSPVWLQNYGTHTGERKKKRNMTCNFFLKKKKTQRPALIVNSHTHGRMWYLTDWSTPAGLSLCLGCGLLATSPSSYRNAMVKRRIGESQGGAGPASILLLPYHLHRRAAAVCICTQKAPRWRVQLVSDQDQSLISGQWLCDKWSISELMTKESICPNLENQPYGAY